MRKNFFFAMLICFSACATAQEVSKLKITILSTMVADQKGVGEWGFSALVEADSSRILFDVGGRPTTVRDNAAELKIDLGGIRQVVLSHNHLDHTAGLTAIRRQFADGTDLAIGKSFLPIDLRRVHGCLPALVDGTHEYTPLAIDSKGPTVAVFSVAMEA